MRATFGLPTPMAPFRRTSLVPDSSMLPPVPLLTMVAVLSTVRLV